MAVLVFLLGGLFGMLRGLNLGISTQFNRIIVWGLPVGALVGYLTQSYIYGFIAIGLAGLGVTIGYWGDFDLTKDSNRTLINYGKLSATGMFRMLPLAIGVAVIGHYWAFISVLAGVIFVPAYLIAIRISQKEFTLIGDYIFYGTILTAFYLGFYL